MHINLHKLIGADGDNVAPFQAATCVGGRMPESPTLIILHDTAQYARGGAVRWFTHPQCNVSAHVVVERDSSITQLVGFNTIAFHAGKSSWEGRENCNVFSIGIELTNPGFMEKRGNEAMLIYRNRDANGKTVERIVERFPLSQCKEITTKEHGRGCWLPYTEAQVEAVIALCKALVAAYPSIKAIGTHWLVSPKRKVDTNPTFPLERVRQEVFGIEAAVRMHSIDLEPIKKPNIATTAYESKSVWAILMGGASWVASKFEDAVNSGLDWLLWAVGILPNVVSEVRTSLSNGEMVATWLKLNWPRMAIYVTVICLAIAVIRHINDKRKLAQAQQ